MALFRDSIERVLERTVFSEIKHLRFQFLFFAGLVLVPLLCGFGRPAAFATLAGNLLYVEGLGQAVWILQLSLISSWTGMVMVFIVLDLGPKRFGPTGAAQTGTDDDRSQERWWRLLLFGLPVLAPAIGMLFSSTPPLKVALGLVFAIAAGLLGLWLTTVIYYLVLPVDAPDVNLLLPKCTVPRSFHGRLAPRERPERSTRSGVDRSRRYDGYFDDKGIWYAQHLVMFALTFVVAVIYAVVVIWGFLALRSEAWAPIMPAFSYLELGWLLVGTILTGLAFFFDGPVWVVGIKQLHVPVLLVVGGFVYINAGLGNFYQLREPLTPAPARAPLKPEQAIDALFPSKDGNGQVLTVVCASGGGIQASAWAAQVLTGLEEKFHQPFTNSIGLISSVSGGSVGSMYYLEHRFRHNNSALQTDEVLNEAEASSLEAALWGLIGPGPFRFFTSFLPIRYSKIDRGWALEQVWRGAARSIDPTAPPINDSLSEWRYALGQGKLPAVVFNATNVETGYPVLIGTTEVPEHGNAIQIGDGPREYADADIAVATAARLSASFTYVSPVASAVCNDGQPCPPPGNSTDVCDGGYFDNFGVWSAVKWLRAVLKASPGRFKKVVILQIWAFPFHELGDLNNTEVKQQVNQISAPVTAVLNVRTASQLSRNKFEIRLLQDQFPGLIEDVRFEASKGGPLSWMLPPTQKKQIESDWDNASKGDEMKKLEKIY